MSRPLWYNCSRNHGNMDGVQGLLWVWNVSSERRTISVVGLAGALRFLWKQWRLHSGLAPQPSCNHPLAIILCRLCCACRNKMTCNKLLINLSMINTEMLLHTSENWQKYIKNHFSGLFLMLPWFRKWNLTPNPQQTFHLFWSSHQKMDTCYFCPKCCILCHYYILANIWSITYKSLDQIRPFKFSFVRFSPVFTRKLINAFFPFRKLPPIL